MLIQAVIEHFNSVNILQQKWNYAIQRLLCMQNSLEWLDSFFDSWFSWQAIN